MIVCGIRWGGGDETLNQWGRSSASARTRSGLAPMASAPSPKGPIQGGAWLVRQAAAVGQGGDRLAHEAILAVHTGEFREGIGGSGGGACHPFCLAAHALTRAGGWKSSPRPEPRSDL